MKKSIFALALLVVMTGCLEKSHLNDNLYDSSVYLIHNGLYTTETFVDAQDSYRCQIPAYCGGYYGGNPEVAMSVKESLIEDYNKSHGTQLKVLPAGCYTLDVSRRTMENKKATFNVLFNPKELINLSQEEDYSDLAGYAVPLQLESNDENIKASTREGMSYVLVQPDMQKVGFYFKEAGNHVLNYSDAKVEDGKIVMNYTVYTPVENQWENPVIFKLNGKTTGLEHKQLPEGSYSVEASADGFTKGVSEINYTVRIDVNKLPEIYYSVLAEVESGGNFVVMGEKVSNTTLFTSILFDQTKLSIYDCNSWQSELYDAPKMLDGDPATFWHCAYNKNMHGVYGAVDFEIIIKAENPAMFNTVSILRRPGGYASDLKSGYIMVAADNGSGAPGEFTKVGEFDWPKAQYPDPGPYLIPCSTSSAVSFIKIVCTDSNRFASSVNRLANIAEFNAYYR